MANTIHRFDGDGVQTDFQISFEYLRREFVKVFVGNVSTAFTFHTEQTVRIIPAPAAGSFITIQRQTSSDALVTFVNGSVLMAPEMNLADLQSIHLSEEAHDVAAEAVNMGFAGHFNARGLRITGMADPVNPGDAVTKGSLAPLIAPQVDAAQAAQAASETARDQSQTARDESRSARDTALGHRDAAAQSSEAATLEANRSRTEADRAAGLVGSAVLVGNTVQFSTRAQAVAASIPAEVSQITVLDGEELLTFGRDDLGTALTAGDGSRWSPLGPIVSSAHYGSDATSFAAAVADNPERYLDIPFYAHRTPTGFAGTMLEYRNRTPFRVPGSTDLSNNATQHLFRAEMASRVGGPRTIALGLEMNAFGSGVNGPSNADIAFEIHADKHNYLSASAERGEIDGHYIFVRQGNRDDAGGMLIDARKTRLGVDDTGGLVGIECTSAINDGTGAVTQSVQTILGFQEGLGGFTNAKGSGFTAEARVGETHSGFAAISRTDIAGTSLDWAFYAGTTRSPDAQTFGVKGSDGALHMGLPASKVILRALSTNLDVLRTDGSLIGRFRSSGVFEAGAGIMASSDSAALAKVFTHTAALDYPSIAAHGNANLSATITGAAVGDLVVLSPTNNLFSAALSFVGHVTSANTVTVHCRNHSGAAIDPASQTLKIMIIRFG